MAEDEEMPPSVKAPLIPSEWHVECPCCGASVEVEKVEEDDAGVFYAAEDSSIVHCEACDTWIDPGHTTVREHEGGLYFQPRY